MNNNYFDKWFRNSLNLGIFFMLGCLAIPSASLAQMAPSLSVEFRTDAEIRQSDSQYDPTPNQLVYLFKVQRAHLNMSGDFSSKLSYRMRLRWNESFEGQTDGTSLGLEYWYIQSSLSQGLNLRLGKQFVLQGGREGSYNSMDVLKYSKMGERLQGLYEVGLSAIYEPDASGLKEHVLIFQFLNQPGGGNSTQSEAAFNLAWYGTVMEGLFETIVQIGSFPQNRLCDLSSPPCGPDWKYFQPKTMISLGTKINWTQFTFDIDFLQGEFVGNNGDGNLVKHQNESFILFIRQNESELSEEKGELFPFLKWIYDKSSQSESQAQDLKNRRELHIGTEYYPIAGNHSYRWHAMILSDQSSLQSYSYSEYRFNIGISARFE
ncbi:porin [Deltaproteobacteria bacterium TL4]